MSTPKYRDDIKGNVAAIVADFQHICANALADPDNGIMVSVDCLPECILAEYRDLLTEKEMARAFKAAARNGSPFNVQSFD